MGRIPTGVPKTNQQNTSPTPTAAAWSLRQQQQQPVSEGGYQYSQLSPSRSPSGPTYTTLSGSGQTARQATYHTATTTQQQGWFCLEEN